MKTLGFFLLMLLPLTALSNELKLHFMRSPLGVNWASPWTLTTSILKNQVVPFKKKRAYSISHVFVEVKCNSNGKHILRGMTSATTTEERDLVFKKKYGLGTMFHFYKGRLEKNESILRDLAPYAGSSRKAELTIKTSGEACERMLDYAQEYEDLGYGNKYSGLQADPLKREGAGCSAFGVSFMRVAGLMDDFTNEWRTSIDVPNKFIGGPMTGNKVDILYILARPYARWSNKSPHVHLEFWNPEAMHSWVKKTYFEIRDGSYEGKWPANISRFKDTFKVELDMETRQTPEGSFWL
jgi:hypothetical protein